ncbi:MAG: hypothetical protein P8188_16395, partial [Gemmatimonadota bacterium]
MPISRTTRFLAELRRRKVYHVAVAYVVVGLGVLGAAEVVLDPLGLGEARPLVVILVLLGFPLALVLAWAYELRPEEEAPAPASGGDRTGDDASGTEGSRKSIVVLPFDNMSPDPGDAYFSEGLTDEIITHLSRLHSLRVISRSSAIALKGTRKDVRTIGRELGVQYVLEGSVRKAGPYLRITAQLIDAATDEHLWAERYEGALDDVFRIQEDASRAIVEALDLEINPGERAELSRRTMDDPRAYEVYLRAKSEIYLGTPESLDRARRRLEAAMETVGPSQVTLQGLAETYIQMYEFGIKTDDETLHRAEEMAERAAELGRDSAVSHYLQGRIARMRGNHRSARRRLGRAHALDPNHSGSLLALVSRCALQLGRAADVERERAQLEHIDPFNPLARVEVGPPRRRSPRRSNRRSGWIPRPPGSWRRPSPG